SGTAVKVQPFSFPPKPVEGSRVSAACSLMRVSESTRFRWAKDGKALGDDPQGRIKTRTDTDFSMLTIDPARQEDSGNYTCTVMSKGKSDTFSARLIVYGNMPAQGKGKTELMITKSTKMDAGTYSCTASNGFGSDIHDSFFVKVYENIKVVPFYIPDKVLIGDTVKIVCYTNTVQAPLSFKWTKDGKTMHGDEYAQIKTHADLSTLILGPVKQSHTGNYTCQVHSPASGGSYTAPLLVYEPPEIQPMVFPTNLKEGAKFRAFCSATGSPPFTFKWLKNNQKLPEDDTVSTENAKDYNILVIGKLRKSHAGNYTCIVLNRVGKARHTSELVVNVPARFEEKFKVQTVRRGEAATLQCQAIGDSPLEITWSQDKKRLIFAPVTRYEKFESNTENGVTSELVIPTTDRSDAALYTCVAKNEYGSDERNIKLLVVEVPAQPLDLRILEVWSRKVNVIWSEPYSGNSPINTYIVHYWRDRDGAHRLMEQSVPSSQTSAMISELHPGASYSLTVTAENEVGQGPPLGPGALPHRRRRARWITNRRLGRCQGTYIHRRFVEANPALLRLAMLSLGICSPPPRDTWNGVLKGYYVGYRAADSSQQPYSFKTVETVVNGSQEVTLVGLTKSSRYSVIVKAFTAIGSGPPLGSPAHVPLPPALTLISSTDSAFKVKWTRSKATVAPVTGYTLHYKKNAGPWHHIPVVASDDTSYTLTDLDGGATYKVYLTASNQFGRGSGSEAIIINTTNHGYDRNWVFYKDPSLLVPAASFLIAVLVVITVVTVCIKKTKAHKNFEKSLEAEKRQSYGEVTQQQQRYIDVTEKRNRSDYATIQSRRSLSGSYKIEELRSAAPNRGYNTTDAKDRRRSSLRKSSASSHVYDSAA
ncbi:hypothetical protein MRX96_045140, partial [Rhipicephalus microplus]